MQYRSDSIIELTKAMIAIQKQLPPMYKTGVQVSGQRSFKVVRLEHMLFILLPIANKHDVHIAQEPRYNNDDVMLETLVTHVSGEWRSSLSFLWTKESATTMNQQDLGKIMTYRCRQDLRAMFGIMTGDQDFDDGLEEFVAQTKPAFITDTDVAELKKLIDSDEKVSTSLFKLIKVSKFEEIPYDSFETVKDTIVKIKTALKGT